MDVPGTDAPFDERTLSIRVAGVDFACRLTVPSCSPRAAVLVLPGSLRTDADGNIPSRRIGCTVYADLARQLAGHGFVVLRMARLGPGTGCQVVDPPAARRHGDFATRVDVAAAGLTVLRRSTSARPVFVAGHGEGAVVAFQLASSPLAQRIDGVVSLSAPALPALDLLREQLLALIPAELSDDMAMFERCVASIRSGRSLPAGAGSCVQTVVLASMDAASLAYLRSLDRVDPASALQRVRCPALIVHGGRDASIPPRHANLLKMARGHCDTEVALIPGLTHFYKPSAVGHCHYDQQPACATDTSVALSISAWSRRLEARSAPTLAPASAPGGIGGRLPACGIAS